MTPHDLAGRLAARYALTPADRVIELGSGDGAFLRALGELGPRVVGVEPDAKLAAAAFAAGVDTVCAAFDADLADRLCRRYGPARVLVTRAATPPGPDVLAAALRCLTPDGVVVLVGGATLTECRPLGRSRAA